MQETNLGKERRRRNINLRIVDHSCTALDYPAVAFFMFGCVAQRSTAEKQIGSKERKEIDL